MLASGRVILESKIPVDLIEPLFPLPQSGNPQSIAVV